MPQRISNMIFTSTFPNRTYCDVLREMREILKYSSEYTWIQQVHILSSLIEELQVYGNRMEAGLEYTRELKDLHEARNKLAKEVKDLETKKGFLTGKEE